MPRVLAAYAFISIVCVVVFEYRAVEGGPPFHGDEATWLANARALQIVLQHGSDHNYWRTFDAWAQPHAGHYVYALVLAAAGIGPQELNRRYQFGADYETNRRLGNVPSPKILRSARLFSALCGAMSCVLLCEIGRRTFGWGVGLIATGWLALNPLMRHVTQRAMIDGQLTLALVAGVLVLMILYRSWLRRSTAAILILAVPAGILFGIAASLKFNGGILCVMAVAASLCFGLHCLLQRKARDGEDADSHPSTAVMEYQAQDPPQTQAIPRAARRDVLGRRVFLAIISVVVIGGLALATFYAMNPEMWSVGLKKGIEKMVELRHTDIRLQQRHNATATLTTIPDRLVAAGDALFVRWPTLRTAPIRDFLAASSAGRQRRGLWYVSAPLFALGVIGLIVRMVADIRRRQVGETCILALWLVSYGSFLAFFLPLAWPRYYQKFSPVQALFFAIGASVAAGFAARLLRRSARGGTA